MVDGPKLVPPAASGPFVTWLFRRSASQPARRDSLDVVLRVCKAMLVQTTIGRMGGRTFAVLRKCVINSVLLEFQREVSKLE